MALNNLAFHLEALAETGSRLLKGTVNFETKTKIF
jgi:hypothetical protein